MDAHLRKGGYFPPGCSRRGAADMLSFRGCHGRSRFWPERGSAVVRAHGGLTRNGGRSLA